MGTRIKELREKNALTLRKPCPKNRFYSRQIILFLKKGKYNPSLRIIKNRSSIQPKDRRSLLL